MGVNAVVYILAFEIEKAFVLCNLKMFLIKEKEFENQSMSMLRITNAYLAFKKQQTFYYFKYFIPILYTIK